MSILGCVCPFSWSPVEQLCYKCLDGAYCVRCGSTGTNTSADTVARRIPAVRTHATAPELRCFAATDAVYQPAVRSFERDLSTCVRSL